MDFEFDEETATFANAVRRFAKDRLAPGALERAHDPAYPWDVAQEIAAGFSVANESLKVMGALGFTRDTLVEYCLRRTRGWMIVGGSLEILRNRIAESVFDCRFDQRAGGQSGQVVGVVSQ
jgi:alkylation response protein AidB-like acyl-CoA dehydrogenase